MPILWWGGTVKSTEHTAYLRLNLRRGVEAPASGSIALNGQRLAEQIGARFSSTPGRSSRLEIRPARRPPRRTGGQGERRRRLTPQSFGRRWRRKRSSRATSTASARRRARADPGVEFDRAAVADIRQWRREYPDWRDARQTIEARYGYDKYPGHCHVVPNHALMIMALLYAPDDFSAAQTIVCTSGWDTDCNAGNVGCLMGAMLGLEGIEANRNWRGPIADRMLISSADGGYAINDAVRVSARLVDSGRRVAGLPPSSRLKRARSFTFRTPAACRDSRRLATAPRPSSLGMFPCEAPEPCKSATPVSSMSRLRC